MTEPTGREPPVQLLAQQQQFRRSIERSIENFKKIGRGNLTPAKIRSRVAALKETWSHFRDGHFHLSGLVGDAQKASMSYFKDNAYEKTEDAYLLTLDVLAESLEELEPPVSVNQSFSASSPLNASIAPRTSLPHLPPINLPPFDGDYAQWEHFRDRFSNLIIKNSELKNFARMHYLVSSLKGNALAVIKDLAITADNFDAAWKVLTARYDNKRRLLGLHLSTLLNLPAVARESPADLQALLEKLSSALSSLNNLNRSASDLWHDMLVHLVCAKLDSSTRKAWSLKSCDSDEPISIDELINFIRSRARALEECTVSVSKKPIGGSSTSRISASTASPSPMPRSANTDKQRGAHASLASGSVVTGPSCPLCKGRHMFQACHLFVNSSANHRRELVKQHTRCFNCLGIGHFATHCSNKHCCRICHNRHHTLLHTSDDRGSASSVTTPTMAGGSAPPPVGSREVTSLLSSIATSRTPRPVLLATAWVSLRGAFGRTMRVRALFDQGSEMTFVSERAAQTLRLKRLRLPVSVSAVGGVHAGTFRHACEIAISPVNRETPVFSTTALIMNHLTSYAPRQSVDLSTLSYLRDLELADATPSGHESIDIIIGADLYTDVLLDGVRKGEIGQPIAQKSAFGWIISGPVGSHTSASSCRLGVAGSSVHVSVNHCCHSSDLVEELRRFWEVEELPRHSV